MKKNTNFNIITQKTCTFSKTNIKIHEKVYKKVKIFNNMIHNPKIQSKYKRKSTFFCIKLNKTQSYIIKKYYIIIWKTCIRIKNIWKHMKRKKSSLFSEDIHSKPLSTWRYSYIYLWNHTFFFLKIKQKLYKTLKKLITFNLNL